MRNLHNDIMNIQIGGNGASIAKEALTDSGGVHIAYKIGHRDARHAAAELANKYDYNHERLVSALKGCLSVMADETGLISYSAQSIARYEAEELLAQLQADKGGE